MEITVLLLTKIDGSPILVNLETIKYIESMSDTRVIFINGDILLIKETLDEIQQHMIKLKSSILQQSKI